MPLSRSNKILITLALLIVGGAIAFIAYFSLTLSRISDAYAAWDTGTLLVEYLKSHNNQWPKSWDDLLTTLDTDTGKQIPLRGSSAGDRQYAENLHHNVAINWSFNPATLTPPNPVTRPDGKPFPMVWQDPNELIRTYLTENPTTRPSTQP